MNFDPKKIEKQLKTLVLQMPLLLGNEAVNFFQENFTKREGFIDKSREKWKKRKQEDAGRGILIKSGRLVRSIRISSLSPSRVTISTDVPYAEAHNEGQTLKPKVTPKMRKFAWAKYYESNKQEEMWKRIALTKKETLNIKMPQRKFMGESEHLRAKLNRLIERELKKRLGN